MLRLAVAIAVCCACTPSSPETAGTPASPREAPPAPEPEPAAEPEPEAEPERAAEPEPAPDAEPAKVAPAEPPEAPEPPPLGDPPRDPPRQPKLNKQRLTTEQLAAIHELLAAQHRVPVKARASVVADAIAFVLYDYNRHEACLLTETKAACRDKLGNYDYEPGFPVFRDFNCRDAWLVRVELGETPQMGEPLRLAAPCRLQQIRRFATADVDDDGQQELVVDAMGVRSKEVSSEPDTEAGRVTMVLRMDGSVQLDFTHAWQLSTANSISDLDGKDFGYRYWFRDVDADGHRDFEIETRPFAADDDFDANDLLWPAKDEDHEREVHYAARRYDPGADAWVTPPT